MAEQLELVTTNPPDFLRHDWHSISFVWSGFTSGMTSGTSFAMRSALEFVITAHPASAKRGSISAAIDASSAARITLGAPSGVAADTRIPAIRSGVAVSRRQH